MKNRSPRYLAAFLIAALPGIFPVHAADHGSHAMTAAKQAVAQENRDEAAPKLILSAPRADFLQKGYVYVPFRVENMTILPLYAEIHGEEVTHLKPKIGHLHVKVDGNQWSWIHAQTDPIYFSTLPSGVHHLSVELADAAHTVIETQTMELVVP